MPRAGETLNATDDVLKAMGGKGANQAISAVRVADPSEFEVVMLGNIGDDVEGKLYTEYLIENNIKNEYITVLDKGQTGKAYVLINKNNAQNSIIVVGGAN